MGVDGLAQGALRVRVGVVEVVEVASDQKASVSHVEVVGGSVVQEQEDFGAAYIDNDVKQASQIEHPIGMQGILFSLQLWKGLEVGLR